MENIGSSSDADKQHETKSHKAIAREVHNILYSKRTDLHDLVIYQYMDGNAVFEDPLVYVQGHSNIIQQFCLLAAVFPGITPEVHSVTECATAGNHHLVIIDAIIKYRLPIRLLFFLRQELELRTISRFEFNEQKKIVRHEDVWSMKDLVENLPLIGWLYAEVIRKSTGYLSSQFVAGVKEVARKWNEWDP
ncbi:5218_t:CDS:2 [Ambispora gerdemannii]|uniref:5218_t:CDS:1 n=1 Tax=Ambispora gerdemannii TaxID=144530 RepID=A0A9N8Z452_9GLOM|nr:5218_t:CDS:2 [Ambispora gerdemannii]